MDNEQLKKILLFCGVLLLTACGHPKATTEGAHEGNILALNDSTLLAGTADTLRFGQMQAGEKAVQTLWVENHGTKPVVILKYDRSCGCASLDFSNQPILPDAAQKLTVTFDSSGEWGLVFKRMDVSLAGATEPLRLYVEAQVEQKN